MMCRDPESLSALAAGLDMRFSHAEICALSALAAVWDAEQVDRVALAEQMDSERLTKGRLTEQLTAAQKRLEVLEQDRKWWQENAIQRRRRAETRRSGRPPSTNERT
jgi:hypothetical protein